jgi:hypothetical protein
VTHGELGTTVEVAIIEDLVAALETIKTGAGAFNTNPLQVVRMVGTVVEVPERPAILVVPMNSPRSHDCPNGCRRVDLGLTITCCLDLFSEDGALGRDFAAIEKAIRHFAADVEKAITADHTRGGRAIDTTILAVDVYDLHEAMPVAAADVTVNIPFRHLTQDPTQAQ